jgi:GNAT superfamily N-acetyltransferase
MAAIEPLAIVRLGPDDARAGLALSTEAQWNQNEADWRFFLTTGEVFGVRDRDGLLIASAALLPYGSGNAWISMVLVTANWRRRGLATKLVDACLAAAAKQGLTTWLDATPAGAAVYGPLGFAPTLQLRRLRLGKAISTKAEAPPSPSPSRCDIGEFVARDGSAMGFDRAALLGELGGRSGSRLWSDGGAVALVRDGRNARHIGPVLAEGPDQALAVVDEIVRSETATFLIDAVFEQKEFLKGLTGRGWAIERPFQRMRFGQAATQAAGLPFAVAGPEFG